MNIEQLKTTYIALLESKECGFVDFESFALWFKKQDYSCVKCGVKKGVLEFFELKKFLQRNSSDLDVQLDTKKQDIKLFLRKKNNELPFDEENTEFRCVYCVNEVRD